MSKVIPLRNKSTVNDYRQYVMVQKLRDGKTLSADFYENVYVKRDGCFTVCLGPESRHYIIDWQTGTARLVDTTETPRCSYAWYENWTISEDVMTLFEIGQLEKWPAKILDWFTHRI